MVCAAMLLIAKFIGEGTSSLAFLGRNFVTSSMKAAGSVWVTLHLVPIGARYSHFYLTTRVYYVHRRMPIKDDKVFKCFDDILCFLEAFHECGLIHRDLRWANIL